MMTFSRCWRQNHNASVFLMSSELQCTEPVNNLLNRSPTSHQHELSPTFVTIIDAATKRGLVCWDIFWWIINSQHVQANEGLMTVIYFQSQKDIGDHIRYTRYITLKYIINSRKSCLSRTSGYRTNVIRSIEDNKSPIEIFLKYIPTAIFGHFIRVKIWKKVENINISI